MGLRTAQEVLSELGKARLAVVTFEQIPVVVEVAVRVVTEGSDAMVVEEWGWWRALLAVEVVKRDIQVPMGPERV